ncbi:HD-GYP domain, c-di-GMP phosphodiesterase class II (or its inactivated variant) [Tindallia magadiensis]|uniref:HD-GYP domain, c-di-GMP phosphodiesterase class II (Or its inactivated variant) n=1 Tax=Tindallia magadiensis TaxID=69895 RepID=A0A1I3DMF0_9FIRM|nr:HD-GYP domain-containing protein [Tindallia magadiensis]SFH87876.1 HD-GYP domain, c-di-GMP phosphodiesterase class II (or its inactivated variant) [Tindallia magadiensis]
MGEVIYPQSKTVMISELEAGMMVDQDIYSKQGMVLIPKGQIIEDVERVIEMLMQHEVMMFNVRLPQVVQAEDQQPTEIRTEKVETKQEKQVKEFIKKFDEQCENLKDEFQKILLNQEVPQEAIEERLQDTLVAFDADINVIQLMQKVRNMDDATYTHSHNVALTSHLIGRWLGMADDELTELTMTALLIDIGKMKVPEKVMNLKRNLTDPEYEEVKKHVVYSYEAIKRFDFLSDKVLKGILHHHERMDGSGYPKGLKGNEIPYFSRIIAISDVYNAMTSKRPYREKMTPFEVIQILETEYTEKLDPSILYLFLNRIGTLFIGQQVLLEDMRKGEIIFVPKNQIYRPMVRLEDNTVLDLAQKENRGIRIEEFV